MSVHVFLHDTFADWELGYVLPQLAHHQRSVTTFSLSSGSVKSLGRLTVVPDTTLAEVDPASIEALILPGGLFWKGLSAPALDRLVRGTAGRGATVAGICAATAYLARLGLLDGVVHTSNTLDFLKKEAPGYAGEARYRSDRLAARDGAIVTASGLGAVEFTLEIMAALDLASPAEREAWLKAFKNGDPLPFG